MRCDSLGGDFVCESGKRSKNAKINELENRGIRSQDQMFGMLRFSTGVETNVEKQERICGISAGFPALKPQNCGKPRLYTLRIHNFHRVFHILSRGLHPVNIPPQARKADSTFPNFSNIARRKTCPTLSRTKIVQIMEKSAPRTEVSTIPRPLLLLLIYLFYICSVLCGRRCSERCRNFSGTDRKGRKPRT